MGEEGEKGGQGREREGSVVPAEGEWEGREILIIHEYRDRNVSKRCTYHHPHSLEVKGLPIPID